jgi:tetratricopeptide (TPR) repeat protein
MSLRTLLSIWLLLLGFLLPSLAQAEDEETPAPSEEVIARAQTLLSEANAHYAAKRYDEANSAYQAAYDLTEAPGFLYNIAQSHRLAGQCRDAIEHYEEFLSLDPKTELRSKVEGFVAEMWTCLEEEKRVKEEKGLRGNPPADEGAGSEATVAGNQANPRRERRDSAGPSRLPLAGVTVAAAGVLALGTSAYFGLSARATSKEVESYNGQWGSAQEADEDEAQRFEKLAIVLGVAGTAAIAGGVATYLLTRERSGSRVAVIPSDGGLVFAFSSPL